MFWRVLLVLLLIPSLAGAQEVATIPPGNDKITPLKLEQPAPYPGMLFDYDTALRWGNWLKQYKLRLRVDVERERERGEVKLDAAKKELKLTVDTYKKIEKDHRARILRLEKRNIALQEELNNPAWYKTRTFGIIVGVVATGAVFGLSIYAYDKVR